MARAVDMAGETHSIVVDLSELRPLARLTWTAQPVTRLVWKNADLLADAVLQAEPKAEHLVSTAICEDRTIPGHEPMESTELGDQLRSRPQEQVVCVGQQRVGSCGA